MTRLKSVLLAGFILAIGVSPSLAATITIQPGAYTGRYFVDSDFDHPQHGVQSFNLDPNVGHVIDFGSNIASGTMASYIAITVDDSNILTIDNAVAASGVGTATLTLNSATFTVDPNQYTGKYIVASTSPDQSSGVTDFVVVPGLLYSIDNGAEIGGSAFAVYVGAGGAVAIVPAATSATASGTTVTLSNITVQVNPGTYTGQYRIGAIDGLQGLVNIVLIPTLSDALTINGVGGVFTPGLCEVSPPSLALAQGTFNLSIVNPGPTCGPVYTAQVQQPIKADGSSVFKASRGVVPTKFTLLANGVAACQLPPATISLIRTAGSAPGPINQSDYLQPSDNGSNFRIDTANCQYIYNLGTDALGAGQYLVQISINGVPVGHGVFGVN